MQVDLNSMVNQILNTDEIKNYITEIGNPYYILQLKRLKANLLQVGKKALQSKLRLSEELRKLLHQKSLLENTQVMNEIYEIKKLFVENKKLFSDFSDEKFMNMNFMPEIFLPMERPIGP